MMDIYQGAGRVAEEKTHHFQWVTNREVSEFLQRAFGASDRWLLPSGQHNGDPNDAIFLEKDGTKKRLQASRLEGNSNDMGYSTFRAVNEALGQPDDPFDRQWIDQPDFPENIYWKAIPDSAHYRPLTPMIVAAARNGPAYALFEYQQACDARDRRHRRTWIRLALALAAALALAGFLCFSATEPPLGAAWCCTIGALGLLITAVFLAANSPRQRSDDSVLPWSPQPL